MVKLYQLLLICDYQDKQETHLLFTGSLSQCKGIRILSTLKQKQWKKEGKIPNDAKLTYKIERVKEVKQND